MVYLGRQYSVEASVLSRHLSFLRHRDGKSATHDTHPTPIFLPYVLVLGCFGVFKRLFLHLGFKGKYTLTL